MKKRRKRLPPFDRYAHYLQAVQSPEIDCQFITRTYKELRKRKPTIMREDFCGTFKICCEWVKQNRTNRAIGIDLDPEPLAYGHANHVSHLTEDQQQRLLTVQDSVMTARVDKADVIAALNFSYFFFKSRLMMRQYFARARKGLKKDGILILDAFGGPACQEYCEDKTLIDKQFYYFWEQVNFDPVTNEALFHIHFQRKGEAKRKRVFTYDWRMWSIPEIRDCLMEAGFHRTHVYWEGTTRTGEGNGVFTRAEKGEECEAWVVYIAAEA